MQSYGQKQSGTFFMVYGVHVCLSSYGRMDVSWNNLVKRCVNCEVEGFN